MAWGFSSLEYISRYISPLSHNNPARYSTAVILRRKHESLVNESACSTIGDRATPLERKKAEYDCLEWNRSSISQL
jgi:hypothetical protein